MLTAVVDSGTAPRGARPRPARSAGKTGTAQKFDPATGTYGRGMYLSSFVGFAPAQEPRLVGVVVIDEPHSRHYYGGEIAAPGVPRGHARPAPPAGRPARHRRDPGGGAAARAGAGRACPTCGCCPRARPSAGCAEQGLRARFEGQGPRVLAQAPAGRRRPPSAARA